MKRHRILFLAALSAVLLLLIRTDADAKEMYRLYNPNSGEHFYTGSAREKDNLVLIGWQEEGTAFTAPEESDIPVYRLYNPNAGDHHYTTSVGERNFLTAAGWLDEGIGWYSAGEDGVPVYRQYNPNADTGSHNYTTSKGENAYLVSAGWQEEGIGWYAEGKGRTFTGWTVTQYASVTGSQCMCYTIEDDAGNLAIVDGGWEEDGPALREIIEAHGNHVSAWILTHPHPDHVGAFNAILAEDAGEISIDVVYAVDVNAERYKTTARWYDMYESFEKFEAQKEKISSLVYVKENDTYDILGLSMKVLSVWDEHVEAFSANLLNLGSMVFRLEGREESMLFCADVHSAMEKYIIPAHEYELRADFVQCAHHGNNGLSESFYDLVGARLAFMDAPEEIAANADGAYNGYLLKEYLENRHTRVVYYATAPNRIHLW